MTYPCPCYPSTYIFPFVSTNWPYHVCGADTWCTLFSIIRINDIVGSSLFFLFRFTTSISGECSKLYQKSFYQRKNWCTEKQTLKTWLTVEISCSCFLRWSFSLVSYGWYRFEILSNSGVLLINLLFGSMIVAWILPRLPVLIGMQTHGVCRNCLTNLFMQILISKFILYFWQMLTIWLSLSWII